MKNYSSVKITLCTKVFYQLKDPFQNCRLCSLGASVSGCTIVTLKNLALVPILSILNAVVVLEDNFDADCLRDNRELSSIMFFRSFKLSAAFWVQGQFLDFLTTDRDFSNSSLTLMNCISWLLAGFLPLRTFMWQRNSWRTLVGEGFSLKAARIINLFSLMESIFGAFNSVACSDKEYGVDQKLQY